MDSSPDSTRHTEKKSTLIEFPGVSRSSKPEWRKELSERVREVQEKRARETAREAAEVERQRLEAAIDPPQLELLPPAPMPAMNPLVAAALKRIERAHQTAPAESRQPRSSLATAVAYAPDREDNDMSDTVPSTPQFAFEEPEILVAEPEVPVEKTHHLSVVPVSETVALPPPIETPRVAPKRLIKDDPNDPALNYLDSIARNLCVEDQNKQSASAFRRLVGALLDLIFCAILTAPIAGAMYFTGSNLQDPRAIGVLAGSLVVVTFIYLTVMTALTGRTWAMRLLKLRVIDTKTGLIPTGGQSIGRSFFYLISLATVFGILFGLVSREGYTLHDRFTRTAVVTT
ncbi:MAG TPA: RDD family protein [Pyrinomonadaceae bacterium]|nr:RDD family protein [Pyrinomonadaceae bacterium]